MKLKIGKSGYVMLPPDLLEAVGLSHDSNGVVEVHILDGSVVFGKPLAAPVCSNRECGKPLTDMAICQDCKRAYADAYHRNANLDAAARIAANRVSSERLVGA